ncbi:MAG: ferritin-like domain-containing protein [Alphaproteobacteria bacterium]|nr:ferritin-like domain-containing protein [Alphaproteobacteria bacterium]
MSAALAVGSEEHKRLLCRTLIDTHDPYDPATIAWPALDAESRRRIAELPFWNDAMFDERNAHRKLEMLAATQSDPLLAEAIALQGREEGRHARIIEGMLRAYDVPVGAVRATVPPKNPEWSFIKLGYGECFDSFFAFGMFRFAERSGFFPKPLVEAFEPIVQEEARHILFFQNWIAYVRANRPLSHRPVHRAHCAAGLALSVWSRVKVAFSLKGSEGDTDGSGRRDAFAGGGFALRPFLELCLAENERRLAPYDARLLRPRLIPSLAAAAVRLLPRGNPDERTVGAKA